MADTGAKMINIGFPPELLQRVDSFRFENRFSSRVEAIRWLIKASLDEKLKPVTGEKPE